MGQIVCKIERISRKLGEQHSNAFVFWYQDGTVESVMSPSDRKLTAQQENQEAIATFFKRLEELEQIKSGADYKPITWVCCFKGD